MSHFSQLKYAIVGATGIVGQECLAILNSRNVPAHNVFAIASKDSCGKVIQYGDTQLIIQHLDSFDFSLCQIALFSPGASVSSVFAPKAAQQGCWVIDNTSFFRMDEDVPLIVPEINAHAVVQAKRRIIANPNCSTIQMLMAVQPIDKISPLRTIVVSTYQAVSGAGRSAVQELQDQEMGSAVAVRFARPIARNVIPQIDVFMDGGQTKEEWKMVVETHKILKPGIRVLATCVRVPVVRGHSEAIAFELEDDVPVGDLAKGFESCAGVVYCQDGLCTPLDVCGRDEVFVGRLRKDGPRWYQMWVVADNVRKGAALNAIQIADVLVERGIV
ncbi:MAG: aspartate-semialdehyde dehydrogenase [Holosporales bacterium]|nr:aspartate-semialdehyde dehydrogenase [Holosporales bacterium]